MKRRSKLLSVFTTLPVIVLTASTHVMADECTSMLPYLRNIGESATAASNNSAAASMYNAMLMDTMQRAESDSGGLSIEALGFGSGNANASKNKSELAYHLATSQSNSSSASGSSQWLRNYSNTIASSASTMINQCFNRRGLNYSFIIGGDGKTFFIKATFTTPSNQMKKVTVREVTFGENVSCATQDFKEIDAGESVLKCVRNNSGGDTIVVSTDYGGDDSAMFLVPDTRPRYLEKTVNFDLTWCGWPNCAPDMLRQLAWNDKTTLQRLQPGVPLSCSFFDLRKLNLLRAEDILVRDQTFPLSLISTQKGNWSDIKQDQTHSIAISDNVIKLCGTRNEPFEDWPNLHFNVRTNVKYLERIR